MGRVSIQAAELVILVPDKNMEFAIEGLLSRSETLGVRSIQYTLDRHPRQDSGVFRECQDFLRHALRQAVCALVVFDMEFDRGGWARGARRSELEGDVEARLVQNGWEGRCAAIVIAPELEAWAWPDPRQLADVLGWSTRQLSIEEWLRQRGYEMTESGKPKRPREALEEVLKQLERPRSSKLYRELGQRLTLDSCKDPAFQKLRTTLRSWFPA